MPVMFIKIRLPIKGYIAPFNNVKTRSSLIGVNSVFPLRMSPIFRWSMDKYGYLYFSRSCCAKLVFPVWDAPPIKITIFFSLQNVVCQFRPCLKNVKTPDLFLLMRRWFPLKSVRIPAANRLAQRKNLSPLSIPTIFKQGLIISWSMFRFNL